MKGASVRVSKDLEAIASSRREVVAAAVSAVAGLAALSACATETTGSETVASLQQAIYDVRDFGAMGDGMTNDTTALLAAASAVPVTGGTLYFPEGVYLIDSTYGIEFAGKNHVTLLGNSATIRRKSNAPPAHRLATIENCEDVRILGLTFDLNGTTQYGGVQLAECNGIWIQNCRWCDNAFLPSNYDHYAVAIKRSHKVWFTHNLVEHSKVEFSDGSNVVIADNCLIWSEGSQAIAVKAVNNSPQDFADFTIARNLISDPEGDGINVGTESDATGAKTFRRIQVIDNIIRWEARRGEIGIIVGAQSIAASMVSDSVVVRGNIVHYGPGLLAQRPAIQLVTQAAAHAFYGARVDDNQVVGFVPDPAMQPLYALVAQFLVRGSVARNRVIPTQEGPESPYGIHLDSVKQTSVRDNLVVTSSSGVGYRMTSSLGYNHFEGNRVIGSPPQPYQITPASTDFASTQRLSTTQSLPQIVIPANSMEEQDLTVPGARHGDSVVAQPDGMPGSHVTWSAYVLNNNLVRLRLCNPLPTSTTVTSRSWRVVVERWA